MVLCFALFLGGPSKKKAKHSAAQSVLNQMMGLPNGTPTEEPV